MLCDIAEVITDTYGDSGHGSRPHWPRVLLGELLAAADFLFDDEVEGLLAQFGCH